jgi:hypothetical protein
MACIDPEDVGAPLRFSAPRPRRLLELRRRLHSQRFDRDNLFRPAVLDVFELVASAKVRFPLAPLHHRLAVQLTLPAPGDPGERAGCEVILMPRRSMEPLWSPVVATSGKRRQMPRRQKPRKQAQTVAADCHRLRAKFHGKEGVDGSSPSEGSAKDPQTRTTTVSHPGSCSCPATTRPSRSLPS